MYRVWYTFRNELGEDVRDYLDDNGNGFTEDDAIDIAKQLRYMGNSDVKVCYMGNLADRLEQENVRH